MFDLAGELAARGQPDVLVGEIDLGLQVGADADDFISEPADLLRKRAGEQRKCLLQPSLSTRLDEVVDRLGFGKVHPAV